MAMPQLTRLVAGFPSRRHGFEPGSDNVGFVVDKVALGQVFPEYFGSPTNSHPTDSSTVIVICHLALVQ
jgi:hypothetical protein